MPIYEYECRKCNLVFEEIRSIRSADLPLACENCNGNHTERIISNFFSKSCHSISNHGKSSCGSCSGGTCTTCH